MSKTEKSLKSQNILSLGIFIILNAVVFCSFLITDGFNLEMISDIFKKINPKEGIIGILIPILGIMGNGILSVRLKEILVFWRVRNVLPGCRAFTKLAFSDPRIDIEKLQQKIQNIPTNPTEQNREWYKIYKKHQSKLSIIDSHKNYLLSRDIAGLSFIFLIIFTIAFFFTKNPPIAESIYIVCLLFQYVIISLVARNYGKRFVCNVLAEESSS